MIPQGWTTRLLGDIAQLSAGTAKRQEGSRYVIVDMGSVSREGLLLTHKRTDCPDNLLEIDNLVMPKDDIGGGQIIGKAVHIGSDNTYVLGDHVYRLQITDGYSPYVRHAINSHPVNIALRSKAVGTAQLGLGRKSVLDQEILFPPESEQRAIAEVLADSEALAESLNALILKKQDVRLAAVQHYLNPTALGPDAQLVRLGDVIKVDKGELITAATAKPGNVPVIAGGIDPAYFNSTPNRRGLTITISASGANAGYVSLREGPIWASDCSTISETDSYDIRFVAAQLQARQSQIYQAQFGGAQPHVRPRDVEALKICWLPIELQREVGEMVAAMDAEITALGAQRNKAELVKQGMMQELLSGRVRLA